MGNVSSSSENRGGSSNLPFIFSSGALSYVTHNTKIAREYRPLLELMNSATAPATFTPPKGNRVVSGANAGCASHMSFLHVGALYYRALCSSKEKIISPGYATNQLRYTLPHLQLIAPYRKKKYVLYSIGEWQVHQLELGVFTMFMV